MPGTQRATSGLTDNPFHRIQTVLTDPGAAVREVAARLPRERAGTLLFCSDRYPMDALTAAIRDHLAGDGPVLGCTTAGEIGPAYRQGGLVGVGLDASAFRVHARAIPCLARFDAPAAAALVDELRGELAWHDDLDPTGMFAVVLLDGLSIREELVTAHLQAALRGVPLVGGSAGDGLRFEQTRILTDGAFRSGGGVLALVETSLAFRTFQLQHFEPTEHDLVITEADPLTRTVFEIDGEPAAVAYAAYLGMTAGELDPRTFSAHPLMIRIGDEWHVRAIQRANPDGSLTFFCAIEGGLVLTLARSAGILETLERQVDALGREFATVHGALGFDCILRRLELLDSGLAEPTARILDRIGFAGFSTYGEQFHGVHVSQTLTGVVLGER